MHAHLNPKICVHPLRPGRRLLFLLAALLTLQPQASDCAAVPEKRPPQPQTSAGMLLEEALAAGRLPSFEAVEQTASNLAAAGRLVGNFALQEEFSPDGRLVRRERLDGAQETITYDDRNGRVTAWVTSADGKFEQERLYLGNRLRAVLYVDGSLKSLQYLGALRLDDPEAWKEDTPAVCVIVSTSKQARIYQYNAGGRLVSAFLQDGTPSLAKSQNYADELGQIIPLEELVLVPRK